MDEFNEKKADIRNQIEHLRQMQHYFNTDYDYHHNNNEEQILTEKLQHLKQSAEVLSQFAEGLNELKAEVAKARSLCDQRDQELAGNGEDKENIEKSM